MKVIRLSYQVLSSKALLLWLTCGWILYYVSSAIWMDEAFGFFVSGVRSTFLIQVPFVLFLVCGYLNLVRVLPDKFRGNRIGSLPWLMLSCGALLYFTGFFLSAVLRQQDSRIIGEGHSFSIPRTPGNYDVSAVDAGVKDSIEKSDTSGLLQYEPKISITDGSSGTHEIGAYPPVKIKGTYLHILNYGLAPGVRFYEDGVLIDEGYMPLRLLPPGRSDFFEMRPYPFRFLVFLAPAYTDRGRHHQEPVYDIRFPIYNTRVFSGDEIVAEGESEEGLDFKTFSLKYFEPTYWIQLESARDPGIPVMRTGILILVFGLPLYVLRLIVSMTVSMVKK